MTHIGKLLFDAVDPLQTGYRFDVQFHQFTLYILQDDYRFHQRAFIEIFADLVHAFPRAWRNLILAEASDTTKITIGALALLAAILEEDFWRITLNGDSITQTVQGIPEGRKLGPACFNLIPNTFVMMLKEAKCGVASTGRVPCEC